MDNDKINKLANDIEELRYNAYRRRELHDDPVGAIELEERAKKLEEELTKLLQAQEVKEDIERAEWR